MKQKSLVLIILIFYYGILYFGLKHSAAPNEEGLIDRFGTTIWHTSDKGGESHVYCYYSPQGIYLLKRVQSLNECQGWYGITILNEGKYASEKEKYL